MKGVFIAALLVMWGAAGTCTPASAADSVESWYSPQRVVTRGSADHGYPDEPSGVGGVVGDDGPETASRTPIRSYTAPRSERGWKLYRVDDSRALDEPTEPMEQRLNRPQALQLRMEW